MHHRAHPQTKRTAVEVAAAAAVGEGTRSRVGLKDETQSKLLGRRRKPHRKESASSHAGVRLVAYLVASGFIIFVAQRLVLSRLVTVLSGVDERIQAHFALYDRLYANQQAFQDNAAVSVVQRDSRDAWDDNSESSPILGSRYGDNVTSCPVTVLFMDPRLGDPSYGPGRAAWFALESVAAFADQACVLLITSSCVMNEHLNEALLDGEESITEEQAEASVRNLVRDRSLPLFQEMISQGKVRVSFVDTQKYNLKSCHDFGNPTSAFIHVDFWKDEFLEGIDSDSVLMMQDDAVLCQSLHPRLPEYQEYAYVGGVWPRTASKLNPVPPQGMCMGMPGLWKSWLLPQRRWERFNIGTSTKVVAKPAQLLPTQFSNVCEKGQGPVGNGGFSLRSRTWMRKAIETCPHVKLSGIDTKDKPLACKVLDDVNEDLYFSVVLRGLQAPLPSAVQAALFAVEMMWPQDAMNVYGTATAQQDILSNSSSSSAARIVDADGRSLTIPIGFHKPFWYHSNDLLRSDSMRHACPFLPYIFTPEMSRWREFGPEKQWAGIGA